MNPSSGTIFLSRCELPAPCVARTDLLMRHSPAAFFCAQKQGRHLKLQLSQFETLFAGTMLLARHSVKPQSKPVDLARGHRSGWLCVRQHCSRCLNLVGVAPQYRPNIMNDSTHNANVCGGKPAKIRAFSAGQPCSLTASV